MVIPIVTLVKCNFRTHYKVGSSSILIEWLIFGCDKYEYEVFWDYALLLFFLEAVLQDMAKNNPTKKELDAEIQVTLKHMPAC